MKVIKPNRLSCLTRPYRYLNNDYLAITGYVMVEFSSEFYLETEQRLWGVFNEESVLNFGAEALDFGIPKRTPEIILNAYGFGEYAVNGRTAVSVTVNNVRKDLWVTGDRYWSDGKPSRALPFRKIPINWRNAYGGAGFEQNPLGKGFQETDVNGLRARFLPNIEEPANPIIREGQHCRPAGYSAIAIESPDRNRLLGTYDEQWRIQEFPGFARDIDWSYFNQSPDGQRLNRLEVGDEITFIHMHPEKDRLVTAVPPLAVKALIKREADTAKNDFLKDVPMSLRTYWAYPHLEKAILVYQGVVEISEDDASDISHIVYAVEHCDSPKTLMYYEDIFRKRTHPQEGGFHALLDKQLVDARWIRATSLDEVELSPLLHNKLRKLEKELTNNVLQYVPKSEKSAAVLEVESELAWLRKSQNGKIAQDDIIEEMLTRQRETMTLKAAKERFRKGRQKPKPTSDEVPQSMTDAHQRFLKEQQEALLVSLREEARKQVEAVGGAQATTTGAAHIQLQQLRQQQLEQFEDTVARAPGARTGKRDYSGNPRNLYRIFGLNQRNTEPLPAGFDGYGLHEFIATSASYSGWDVSGLVISDSRISDCDFSKAKMACCDFDRVVFTGCDFSSVDWNRAHFNECQFIDCRLSGVQSDKARFEGCRFVRSDLQEWMHFRIRLKDCRFEHCRFVNFPVVRGRLERVAFEHCHFLRHTFLKGSIDGLRMEACHIDSMTFVEMQKLRAFHMIESNASKLYIAPSTTIDELEISHSIISASSFRKLDLTRGKVMASDLSTCDFSETRMHDVSLADSFFKQSLFIRTDLSGAHISNSDFSEAQMKSADLRAARMQHVSFFSAELAMIKADSGTVQRDMLMERSNIYPLRK
ncbi:DUF2169 domain-containing protein [Bordetella muralis]|uniref:DUF2169 family type VI secretion system accessory protein n=1 Tax=Bordetella muralis TaxID=1649130 RepID=UPI0039F0F18C